MSAGPFSEAALCAPTTVDFGLVIRSPVIEIATIGAGGGSIARDAHMRAFEVTVIEDGCAAFSRRVHEEAVAGLRPVARIATVAELMAEIGEVRDGRSAGAVVQVESSHELARRLSICPQAIHATRQSASGFKRRGGIDVSGRDGAPLPALFAAGRVGVGVSGPETSGYLSGGGLPTATVLKRIAGGEAARLVLSPHRAFHADRRQGP